MARPTDDPKTFRLDLRFPPPLVEAIDEWRRHQKRIPSRAEAIRKLVENGLDFAPAKDAGEGLLNWMSKNIVFTDLPVEAQKEFHDILLPWVVHRDGQINRMKSILEYYKSIKENDVDGDPLPSDANLPTKE